MSQTKSNVSLCLVYNNLELFERFIGFLNTFEKQYSEALINAIINFLKLCNLDQVLIVSLMIKPM